MSKRLYVAYGSNLNIRQMKYRCPGAKLYGTGVIEDYELQFKGQPHGAFATIAPKEGASVPVAVWDISEKNEQALDRYEGYPSFYYKTEMTLPIKGIRSGKVRNRKCFVYIMHEDRPLGIPSGYYVATCLEGYDSFEFDERYLYDAIENSRRDCNEG